MASRIRVVAVAAMLGVLLTGCGSGQIERRELTAASPLAEFLGTPPRNQVGLPHLDERERQRQDAITDLVAQCMIDAGFAYEVVPMADRLGREFLAAYTLPAAEFAQQYGYGATTLAVEEYTDPNQQLRDALPADRQQTYDHTLWGEPGQAGGCYLRASREVYGDPTDRQAELAEFEELLTSINRLYQQIDGDPRLQAAYQRWADCLAETGYPDFATPSQARQSVFDRLSGTPDPDGPTSPLATGPADQPRLAEVREYELALAPVDQACQQRHVASPRRAVTVELERAFLDAHQFELTRYRDWLAGAPGN